MHAKIINNTLLDTERLTRLRHYAELVEGVKGHFAEVGVYKGGSAFLLAEAMKDIRSSHTLFAIDTFTGMPETLEIDEHKPGDFKDTSIEAVRELLSEFRDSVEIMQGVFPKVRPPNTARFALVHLDCDLYTGVRDGLDYFGPRMLDGGFIVMDDVFAPSCAGALKAATEYSEKKLLPLVARCKSQAVFRF